MHGYKERKKKHVIYLSRAVFFRLSHSRGGPVKLPLSLRSESQSQNGTSSPYSYAHLKCYISHPFIFEFVICTLIRLRNAILWTWRVLEEKKAELEGFLLKKLFFQRLCLSVYTKLYTKLKLVELPKISLRHQYSIIVSRIQNSKQFSGPKQTDCQQQCSRHLSLMPAESPLPSHVRQTDRQTHTQTTLSVDRTVTGLLAQLEAIGELRLLVGQKPGSIIQRKKHKHNNFKRVICYQGSKRPLLVQSDLAAARKLGEKRRSRKPLFFLLQGKEDLEAGWFAALCLVSSR